MTQNRIILASLLLLAGTIILKQVSAGPVHSLALTMANRAAKIPRTIRTPFKNTEVLTARGFGKRAESVQLIGPSSMEIIDGEPRMFDLSSEEAAAMDGPQFPVKFIAGELLAHPDLLRQFIRRFLDVNKDGLISERELVKSEDSSRYQ